MADFKPPAVPKEADPKINASKMLKLAGSSGKVTHQAVEHRRGLLARALRGNKNNGTTLPTPQDSN